MSLEGIPEPNPNKPVEKPESPAEHPEKNPMEEPRELRPEEEADLHETMKRVAPDRTK